MENLYIRFLGVILLDSCPIHKSKHRNYFELVNAKFEILGALDWIEIDLFDVKRLHLTANNN
ncbi:hypothetical protein NIES267_39770 [Calothrix parasitica NIES-267]|uniref:Uncharacterized protein n=1 Tax=Calothrix parasitica NIES-267 TaxID=1973488 RepID=A0A1Z4LTK2_9CYAN|nr:hypothetical protein NIES267_39770 [Calothrix parasitica NIES-267]